MKTTSPVRSGAFDYLLRDIEQERLVRLDNLIRDAQKTVTPPPREPERRRTHVTIELIPERRPRRPRERSWLGAAAVWALVALIWISLAHGQPVEWRSQQEGFITRSQGTDRQGGNWTGTSYQQGHMTYFDGNGPNGEVVHCSSYKEGFQTVTRCD